MISEEDFKEIERAGGLRVDEDRVRFDPERVRINQSVSQSVKRLMKKLEDEVW